MSALEARFPLNELELDHLVHDALFEDRAFEDVTTIATVLSDRRARARLVARAPGVLSGVRLAERAFGIVSEKTRVRIEKRDGDVLAPGETVLHLTGPARGLLSAERVALNFLQHLSGIATATKKYVEAVEGTRARILDTRKTIPGWRALAKYAVLCGGGVNHRMDLAAAVLIKDNHLAAVDGNVALAVQRCRAYAAPGMFIQVECDRLEQVEAVVAAKADGVLLDNMSLSDLRLAVALCGRTLSTEASGGVTLSTVRGIAETGVDYISVGALTHSACALDLALDFD